MVVIEDWKAATPVPSFVAIGCFDGLHLAHKAILETVLQGKEEGLRPAVFTFDSPHKGMPLLMDTAQKLQRMESMGIEAVYLVPFASVKDVTAEDFVRTILAEQCGAKKVCCGYNFRFGKGGEGDVSSLRTLCAAQQIEVRVIEELDVLDQPVSSTRIRQLLEQGNVEESCQLLGRPFSFALPVVHGRKLGRQIGVPTMNQSLPEGMVRPKNGVYVSKTMVDGILYDSVTNIGTKPTVGGESSVSAETWIRDFSGDLYGKTISVSLHHFLRPEQKFPSIEVLREQIAQDQAQALAWSKQNRE
jgi:riboflavin kinase/FMN adenylyltransferase